MSSKKYYFPGTPRFGLLSHEANRFFLMTDDYVALKTTQLCFMRSFLYYILDFTKIEKQIPEDFDNSTILGYGLSNAKRLHILPDILENRYSREEIIVASPPTEADISLQEKIFFVFGLVSLVTNLHRGLTDRIEQRFKLVIDGLEISKDFFDITIGPDENRNVIIDRDIADYRLPLLAVNQLKKTVFVSLVDKNYDLGLDEIKTLIKIDLQQIEDFDPEIKKAKKLLLEYVS